MKQVFLSGNGEVHVLDTPLTTRVPDSVLVQNAFSLISSGTEGAAVSKSKGVWATIEKLRASGDRVQQVWKMAQSLGWRETWRAVQSKLQAYTPLGYSSAGQIVEVDNPRSPFRVGQRVACMGAGWANHAEFVVAPKNLTVAVPDGVDLQHAAFGALACIALQGIRRLDLSPGERVGVVGLGLIGQLAARLLEAMGFETYGVDLSPERAAAAASGTGVRAWSLTDCDAAQRVADETDGQMLDGVVICAAAKNDAAVNLSFELCRTRGRVAVVGDVGLGLDRQKMYRKELELRLSCSYGPGRYDDEYEVQGRDYPFAHVRWTERRNLEFFLKLLASGRLEMGPLVSKTFEVDRASDAYAAIKSRDPSQFGVLIDYGPLPANPQPIRDEQRIVRFTPQKTVTEDRRLQIGLIGAGGYAQAIHIPNLRKLRDTARIRAVATRSGGPAAVVARRESAEYACSDHQQLLADPEIDAVLVATRHASHARIVLDALQAGKHVFVEKPMTTTLADARRIVAAEAESGCVVRVGFNRRFAPLICEMRRAIGSEGRRMLSIRVNVGNVAAHWSNSAEEGGRLLGEGVHFFDLACWFLGQTPTQVTTMLAGAAQIDNPNAVVSLGFPDGSTAQITYTTLGDATLGKEYYEAFGNGRTVRCDNYQRLEAAGTRVKFRRRDRSDKGQLGVLQEWLKAIRGQKGERAGADARAGQLATAIALSAHQQTPWTELLGGLTTADSSVRDAA